MKSVLKLAAATLLATTTMSYAGGFARGSADTDILYEEGNFNLRAGATYVNPSRKFTANGNAALVDTEYTETYAIPSAAVKLNINEDMRCAGTFANVYGGSAKYDAPTTSGKLKEEFNINEFGATCGYKFDLSKGRIWLLGGIFIDTFNYDRDNITPLGPVALTLDGTDVGFRLGAAYEIPEIALRAELMYRSATNYGAEGALTAPAGVLGIPLPPGVPLSTPVTIDALGVGNLPQTVELNLQSGVAPGWLVFGSIKWSDWSRTTTLDVLSAASGGFISRDSYYWNDGWTVSAGVGHAFTEKWSGALSVTWDRDVGTGWDLSAETWSIGSGLSYKDDMGGELKFGGGLTYISASAETQYLNAIVAGDPRSGFNSAVGASWAWALGASYKTKW